MKTQKVSIVFLLALLALMGCQKEEVNEQAFVQKFIIGRWPLKYNIRTVQNANFGDRRDTLVRYNPIDTLVFEEGGKVVKRNKNIISTMTYNIDDAGEQITLTGATSTTLKLIAVQNTTLIIGTETTEKMGEKDVKVTVADYYVK